ncbi:MAG: GST-like protein, partial [Alphaproteobacteria bacterium]
MITLHAWPTPNAHKISIMLEECALPYRVIAVDITAGDQFQPDFLRLSPNNRMPAIVDDEGPDGAAVSVFESGAILIYLAEKTGKFLPASGAARIAVLEWLMFQMGNLGPICGQTAHFRDAAPER